MWSESSGVGKAGRSQSGDRFNSHRRWRKSSLRHKDPPPCQGHLLRDMRMRSQLGVVRTRKSARVRIIRALGAHAEIDNRSCTPVRIKPKNKLIIVIH